MALPVALLNNRVLQVIVGTAAGMAAADVFAPRFRNLVAEVERRSGLTRRLTPGEAASAVVRGALTYEQGQTDAHDQGLGHGRFDALIATTSRPPGLAEAFDLLRRGVVTEADWRRALQQSDVKDEWHGPLLALRRVLLSPPALAAAVAQGILAEPAGAELAELAGVTPDDFATLVRTGMRGPDVGQVLELRRRGDYGDDDATDALRRAGVQPEYVGDLLSLQRVLPPVSDLIRFAVREVYTPEIAAEFGLFEEFPDRFAAEAARVGLSREDAELYWGAHWDLPSPEQGFRMFHRRIIDRPRLARLLRALDFMPGWRDELIELAYLKPGRIDLRRMFRAGVLTEQQVHDGYLDLGYDPTNAQRLTNFAIAEKQTEERELTKSEIVGLYEARLETRDRARAELRQLGYAADHADAMLNLADYRGRRTRRNAAVSVIRSRYLAREIDAADAGARLDKLGVPADGRQEYLELWTFQREESPKRMTEAQDRAALRVGLLSDVDYRSRRAREGYEPADVELLARMAAPAAAATSARSLSRADIVDDYREGRIGREQALRELGNQGYSAADAGRILANVDADLAREGGPRVRPLTRVDVLRLYSTGEFDRPEAERRLTALGFALANARILLDEVDARAESD